MKDARLDALLDTLPKMECTHFEYIDRGIRVCWKGIDRNGIDNPPFTNCEGDIRKCQKTGEL